MSAQPPEAPGRALTIPVRATVGPVVECSPLPATGVPGGQASRTRAAVSAELCHSECRGARMRANSERLVQRGCRRLLGRGNRTLNKRTCAAWKP